ncbi:GlxA family transcriptional regulator [Primorskyibacter sp. S87]|uniref:GlxA family transcriptional regulator n=1 Tax=Primorskyibacter sp. S87 TaxID=3415126 RepID=UPI003C7B1387
MQKWEKISAAPQRFGILLFNGFSNHCLANWVEPMRAANTLSGRKLYEWQYLTPDGTPVTSSSGLQVAPHDRLSGARGNLLAVMPSYGFRGLGRWDVLAGLREAEKNYDSLAGLDTGSWLLAEAGLLDGYRATIHWEELTVFAERFDEVDAQRERFIIDNDRVTCSGAMAAFDLIMHMIGRDHGQALAMEAAQLFMTRDSARSHSGGSRPERLAVNRALAIMQEHLEHPIPIAEVARRSGRTQKDLSRQMQQDLGAPPHVVYRRLRLTLARKLIRESDLAVSEIALRCGYQNAAAMTRAFRATFGVTPRDLRRGS